MDDRIKLATAMGWECTCNMAIDQDCNVHDNGFLAFDPFTDANDDYAVLEWARNSEPPEFWLAFCCALGSTKLSVDYQIGDYARAALKVITTDKEQP